MLTMEDIMVEPPADGEVVDPMVWFDSPGPFELEIGCGKGGFLLSRGRAHPEIRLLGIEWANKYYKYAADRMARWKLENVRVMRTDAKIFVMHHLPAACIDVLHIYHPDPWPKKRHHKRRLIQPPFVEAAIRSMKAGARLLIQTDHPEYFEQIRAVLAGHEALHEIDWEQAGYMPDADWGGTNYEIKYAREGRKIFRIAAQKH
jgi:tRNA (guanine-N7-)-methyltransferase